jgi:tRNA(Ile)-lysidine synthase
LPAFVRGRVPLLLCGERVLAVANLPGLDGAAQGDWQLHWQPPTSDQDLS